MAGDDADQWSTGGGELVKGNQKGFAFVFPALCLENIFSF